MKTLEIVYICVMGCETIAVILSLLWIWLSPNKNKEDDKNKL